MFLVIEIQKNQDGTIGVPPISTYENYNSAANKYHTVLASAAISNLPSHSCIIVDDTGTLIIGDTFAHDASAE